MPESSAMNVTVVGSFNVDHVWRVATLPQAGATLAGDYASGPGGKGFNQAMAARRAGADTAFVCALGKDLGAQLARALCVGDGIDLRDFACDAPTGTAGIHVDANGRNSIVVAAGAQLGQRLGIPGEDAAGVVDALERHPIGPRPGMLAELRGLASRLGEIA